MLSIRCLPLNCIGRKELSHAHIKPYAMTRATSFDNGFSHGEVVYWSKWGCILILIIFMFWYSKFRSCFSWRCMHKLELIKNLICILWFSTLEPHRYTWSCSAIATKRACYIPSYGMSSLQLGQTPVDATAWGIIAIYLRLQFNGVY